MESKKQNVESNLKSGKITREKANEIILKIDSKIKKAKEFDSLTLIQKKEKLISKFKTKINQKVKDNKLSRIKAGEFIRKYTDKINNWDGNDLLKFNKGDFDNKFHKKSIY